MSLNAQIQTMLTGVRGQIPPPVFAQLEAVLNRLTDAQVGEQAAKPGSKAPQVAFLRTNGESVSLEQLQKQQTAVLMFYRGGWCPFCDLTLRAFEAYYEKFLAAGAHLYAVSPQLENYTEQTASSRNLSFELLSDPGNKAASAFHLDWTLKEPEQNLYKAFESDLEKYNGDAEWKLPAPAVFVLDRNGIVRWQQVNADYTKRAEPEEVLAAVQAVRDAQS